MKENICITLLLAEKKVGLRKAQFYYASMRIQGKFYSAELKT